MKKLLVTASTFPRWAHDTEPRFILDLCKALSNYYDVTVLVPSAPGASNEERIEGVHVKRYHYFPIHKWETLCYPGAIVPRIKEKKIRIFLVPFLFFSLYYNILKIENEYDLVHSHWLIPQGIVQSFFKKPYLVTGHGADVTSLNKGLIKYLKCRCLKNASSITIVSDQLRDDLLKIKDFNVHDIKNKIRVVSMGVNVRDFGKGYRVENFFNQGDSKVVLFVGRLAEKKGVSYLIDAMKNIDAKLIIVGDGPLRKQLESQSLQYKEKVVFLGSKSHEELKTIYASADVFVAPSITAKDGDKEGFGLVILEAMASGLPVVGSNSGGIPTIIEDGINGFLTEEKNSEDISNKINSVLKDVSLRKKMSVAALSTAEQYDYKVIADKYVKILETIK